MAYLLLIIDLRDKYELGNILASCNYNRNYCLRILVFHLSYSFSLIEDICLNQLTCETNMIVD